MMELGRFTLKGEISRQRAAVCCVLAAVAGGLLVVSWQLRRNEIRAEALPVMPLIRWPETDVTIPEPCGCEHDEEGLSPVENGSGRAAMDDSAGDSDDG